MTKRMKVFNDLPEILALPQDRLDQLFIGWLQAPVAKECGVENLSLGQEDESLGYIIAVDHDGSLSDEEQRYRFPVENLLNYIIDHGFPIEQRETLKARIPLLKQNDPDGYREFTTATPQALIVRCKNPDCGELLGTNVSLHPGQEVRWLKYEPITCPKCGQVFKPDPRDFFTQENWENPGEFKGMQEVLQRDPTAKLFTMRVAIPGAQIPQFLMMSNSLNDREFEGRPAETVHYMGFNKSSRGDFAHLIFLERSVSFNKFFNESTGEWDTLFVATTGEPFLPYRIVDLSILAQKKI
jgi:hypothetical protein